MSLRKQAKVGAPANRAPYVEASVTPSLPKDLSIAPESGPLQKIHDSSIAADGKNYFSILPAEVSEQVFQYLPSADLIRLSCTDRALKEKVSDFASFSALTSASNPFQYIYQQLYSDRDSQTKAVLANKTIADNNKKPLHPSFPTD